MKKLTEYEYEVLHQCEKNPDAIMNKIQTDFILNENGAIELVRSSIDLNQKNVIKNLRTLAENLITKYYFYHNNKKQKSHA